MLEHFNNLYAKLLLLAFCVKFILMGSTSLTEGLVAISLVVLIASDEYLNYNKKHKELVDVVNKQSDALLRLAQDVDMVKTNITGIRLGQGFKKVS